MKKGSMSNLLFNSLAFDVYMGAIAWNETKSIWLTILTFLGCMTAIMVIGFIIQYSKYIEQLNDKK